MSSTAHTADVVETTSGTFVGVETDGVLAFLGIPYGVVGVGRRRFERATPATPPANREQPSHGPRVADTFGPIAVQPHVAGVVLGARSQDEQCLNLNIWVRHSPERSQRVAEPRPVLVWVHGGGYLIGCGSQPVFNGTSLAKFHDAIVVTLNYRLGVLGFMNFAELSDEHVNFEPNLGLNDVVLALRWVRDNIAAFGGDPSRVTIFGESAGAAIVATLMTISETRGLFQQAIMQSPPISSVYGAERSRAISERYLKYLRDQQAVEDPLHHLISAPAADLVAPSVDFANQLAAESPGVLAFAPTVDGALLTEDPLTVMLSGGGHRIPIIIGYNRDESHLFRLIQTELMPKTVDSVQRMLTNVTTAPAQRAALDALYGSPLKLRTALEISSDASIVMPSLWMADAHSALAPTYVYRFDQAPPVMRAAGYGAIHASELPYVFDTIPDRTERERARWPFIGGTRIARRVARRMSARWAEFSHSGSPQLADHSSGEPGSGWDTQAVSANWPMYRLPSRKTLLIGATDQVVEDPERARRSVWLPNQLRLR